MIRRLCTLALMGSLALVGCAGDFPGEGSGIDDDFMDDPPPPGGCQTDCPTPGSDGSPIDGPCLHSSDCVGDAFCAADFDGEVGEFTCQVGCIPQMDEAQWCSDDGSCCEDNVCSPRGFCVPPMSGVDSGDSSSGGSTDGSSSSGSSGSDSSGSGGSGSGSESGTTR